MWNALKYSARLEILAMYVFIHAIFPFWCEFSASDGVEELEKELNKINYTIVMSKGDSDKLAVVNYEEHRKKWKETPEDDPIEKELALSRYIELKFEYYDLIQQIKGWD